MFQIQKAKGKNRGRKRNHKNSPIITVMGTTKKRKIKPLPILPAYIWPKPGIKRDRTAAKPEFLVPNVTLEVLISLRVGTTFKGLPQLGHTFISSVTSFPHLVQKAKNQSPSKEDVIKLFIKNLCYLLKQDNKLTLSLFIWSFSNI